MKLQEYCDTLNIEIRIIYYPNQDNRWSAAFNCCEVSEGSMLISQYGDGNSPDEAIREYINCIEGKKIVFNAGSDDSREYVVPKGIIL